MSDEPLTNEKYRALDEAIAEGSLPSFLEDATKRELKQMLLDANGPDPSKFVDSHTRRVIRARIEFLEECERDAGIRSPWRRRLFGA